MNRKFETYIDVSAEGSVGGIIKTPGMFILHDYYEAKQKHYSYPVYILNSPKDLPLISQLAENKVIYAVIFQYKDSHHKTPLVIKQDTKGRTIVIVLDSLGKTGNAYAMECDAILSEVFSSKKLQIIPVDHQRQSDYVSCGTDAQLVIKEALRLGENLFKFYLANDEDNVPGEIAKYTQSIKKLENPSSNNSTNLYEKKGLYDKYPKSRQQVIPVNKKNALKQLETPLDYTVRHKHSVKPWNNAVDVRRNKHIDIIKRYLQTKTDQELLELSRDASGITELKANIDLLQGSYKKKDGFGPSDEILDLMGVRTAKKLPDGKEIEMYNYSLFADEIECKKRLDHLEKYYLSEELKFLEGRGSSLVDLAKILYAQHRLKQEMEKAIEKNKLGETSHSPSVELKEFNFKSETKLPAVGRSLMFPIRKKKEKVDDQSVDSEELQKTKKAEL